MEGHEKLEVNWIRGGGGGGGSVVYEMQKREGRGKSCEEVMRDVRMEEGRRGGGGGGGERRERGRGVKEMNRRNDGNSMKGNMLRVRSKRNAGNENK